MITATSRVQNVERTDQNLTHGGQDVPGTDRQRWRILTRGPGTGNGHEAATPSPRYSTLSPVMSRYASSSEAVLGTRA